jgi:hypothetical protein
LLTDFHVRDCNRASIVVDTPAILLDAVDTLGIGADIVNIHGQNRVVGIDVNIVDIVCRTHEPVTIYTLNESLSC